MDQSLSELERQARANPEDRDLADRLDRALLRAGQSEALLERYRSKFQCPLRFEELDETSSLSRRTCQRCRREVFLVRTPEELAARVDRGQCVAISRELSAAAYVELGRSPGLTSAVEPWQGQVHESELRFLDLDQIEVPERVIDLLPAVFAHTYQVVPVAELPSEPVAGCAPLALAPTGEPVPLEDPITRLQIVCSPEASSTVVEDIEFMLDIAVEVFLAEPEQLERALERCYPDVSGFGELEAREVVAG